MLLDAKNSAFGRHQTFPLRFGWLTKGFQATQANPKVFDAEDATITLGVGKNMVAAIQYWLLAAQVLKLKSLQPTEMGQALFAGAEPYDLYLEDQSTLWLLHWLIASNTTQATTFFWFFNTFYKTEFTAAEVIESLDHFLQHHTDINVSKNTLKQDVAVLLRMYAPTRSKRDGLEDSLDSPLAELRLIQPLAGKRYQFMPADRLDLPVAVLGFALAELFAAQPSVTALPINELYQGSPTHFALGAIFRLTEEALMAKLESLIQAYPKMFGLRETAGLYQLFRQTPEAMQPGFFLRHLYVGIALEQ